MPDSANIARHLPLMAARQPDHPALKIPRGRTPAGAIDYLTLTFAELDRETNAWCARLTAAGIQRGDRTLLMVKQGLPLIAAAFALFKLGAVPVVIDPGMGLKNFLRCVQRSRPRALVGIPVAQILSHLFRPTFRTVQIRVRTATSPTARLASGSLSRPSPVGATGDQLSTFNFQPVNSAAADLAAVLFTSGSTGAPKGVCYEHGMFEAQVRLIRETYNIQPGEVDLPMLPIFALFNPALGMTTIVPEIDPSRPADVDPAKIVQAIQQEGVTNSFGSPTLWRKISAHCVAQNLTLPTLRRVLCAGAPVPAALWKNARAFLPHGQLHSPYGATEALPLTTISSSEIAQLDPCPLPLGPSAAGAAGSGACVGHPLPGIAIRIIGLTSPTELRELPVGKIGEIIVSGPVVTKIYDALPEATAAAKITDGEAIWHRMGDCGYFDDTGRLWFCGRKVERVETRAATLHTEPCEQVFRAHPRVSRCALIGLGERGHQEPALVVEAKILDSGTAHKLARELRLLALQHPHTAAIKTFYFHPKFPVDVRHNAKIHRLTLAQWAATAEGIEPDPKR
jgi:acyl-CoA synthetase (AMP-forming)/AMP-acid ligase II